MYQKTVSVYDRLYFYQLAKEIVAINDGIQTLALSNFLNKLTTTRSKVVLHQRLKNVFCLKAEFVSHKQCDQIWQISPL